MQRLSRERFEAAKPYLRRTIPHLFGALEVIDRPLYEKPYAHPNSMLGALAVQRLAPAGNVIRLVDLNGSRSPHLRPRPHVINDISGEGDLFDVFGFTPTDNRNFVKRIMAGEPVHDDDGLILLVERVLDPVRETLGLPTEVLK